MNSLTIYELRPGQYTNSIIWGLATNKAGTEQMIKDHYAQAPAEITHVLGPRNCKYLGLKPVYNDRHPKREQMKPISFIDIIIVLAFIVLLVWLCTE